MWRLGEECSAPLVPIHHDQNDFPTRQRADRCVADFVIQDSAVFDRLQGPYLGIPFKSPFPFDIVSGTTVYHHVRSIRVLADHARPEFIHFYSGYRFVVFRVSLPVY